MPRHNQFRPRSDADLIAEFWRIAAPFLLFGWGVVCGIGICGSLISWGWA